MMLLFFGLIVGFLIGVHRRPICDGIALLVEVAVLVAVKGTRFVLALPERIVTLAMPIGIALLIPWMIYTGVSTSGEVFRSPARFDFIGEGGGLIPLNASGVLTITAGTWTTTSTSTTTTTVAIAGSSSAHAFYAGTTYPISCSILTGSIR